MKTVQTAIKEMEQILDKLINSNCIKNEERQVFMSILSLFDSFYYNNKFVKIKTNQPATFCATCSNLINGDCQHGIFELESRCSYYVDKSQLSLF